MVVRRIALLVLVLAFIPVAHAANIEKTDVHIALDNEGDAYWEIGIKYAENVTRSDYFVLSQVRNVKVYSYNEEIDCITTQEAIGYSILCNKLNADSLLYTFQTTDITKNFNEFTRFDYMFPITNIVSNISIRIDLPLGTAVAEENKLANFGAKPFMPDNALQSTDGRVIYLSWGFEKPRLGESIQVSLYFEQLSKENQVQQLVAIIMLIGVFAAIAVLFIHSKRSSVKDVLPVLTNPEREVMQILIRENKEVDQRLVVKELDYSKSKISRVISELEKRGLIDKRIKGRTNILRLRKSRNVEKALKTPEERKKDETVKKLLGKDNE